MHALTELFPNPEVGNAVHEYCITNSTSVPPHFDEHRQATIDYCLKEGLNANMMINTLQVCISLLPAKVHSTKRSRGG